MRCKCCRTDYADNGKELCCNCQSYLDNMDIMKLIFGIKEENKELKNMLKKIEFCFYAQKGAAIIKICPVCKYQQHRTHKNDCKLFKILKMEDE